MNLTLINHLQDVGKAEKYLRDVVDDPILEDLSKHNPYWHHKDEEIHDKLDEVRRKLMYVEEQIHICIALLRKEDDDG